MADDKLTIKIVADKVLQSAQSGFEKVQKAGKVSKTDEAQFQALSQQLKDIGNTANVTKNTYYQLNNASKQLNNLMRKLGESMGELSVATKEQMKAIKAQQQTVKAVQGDVTKQGSALSRRQRNLSGKAENGYGYSNDQLDKIIKQADIKWAKNGNRINRFDSAGAHMAAGEFQYFENSDNVKTWFLNLQAQEKTDVDKYLDTKAQLTTEENKLKDLEAKVVTISAGEDIIINATKAQSDVESFTHEATDVPPDETNSDPVAPAGGVSLDKQKTSLGGAIKQLSLYRIAWAQVKKLYHEVISTITELDKSLTEQAMVTGKTRQQTYALLSSYQSLASELGTTTKEIASVATEYMRQGKTIEESLTLTSAAVSAAKVAGISASESIDYLTTALNGFQLSASDAMSVSDKFAAVAATSATDYEELAVALSKVASQANLAGMSIDYTTALLAKGIETTREAPETIGTALKTVIARMREISDYGETLDGSTDVNNVETQLAYVGIALKDANGELRSTEDVLDELGKKWDTLNSNQQAAIAKALAGTRQQSRLIAMMSDYDRVLELQQTSLRSSGATVAQLSTYLEGMEAATNRVNVAIEKITTAFTNSDWIVSLVNAFADIVDFIGSALQNEGTMITVTVSLIAILASVGAMKIKQLATRKKEIAIQAQQNQQEKISLYYKQQQYVVALKALKTKLEEKKANNTATAADLQRLSTLDQEIVYAEKQSDLYKQQAVDIGAVVGQTKLANGETVELLTSTSSWVTTLSQIAPIFQGILAIQRVISAFRTKDNKKEIAETNQKTTAKGMESGAKIISQLGVYGIALAAVVMAAFGIVGAVIGGGLSSISSQEDNAASEINRLSTEIYQLSTKASELQTLVDTYEELDRKIIKTAEDQEEMNTTLDEAADKFSDEQKAIYESLITNQQRLDYIKRVKAQAEADARLDRMEQLNLVRDNSGLLTGQSDNALKVQSAVYATANQILYDYDDETGYDANTESLVQSMLESMSAADAYIYAMQPTKIKALVDAVAELDIADTLLSSSSSLSDLVAAYKSTSEEVQELLDNVYPQLSTLSSWGAELLTWLDSMGISSDKINDVNEAIYDLGYSAEEAQDKTRALFNYLANHEGVDLQTAITAVFGNLDENTYNKTLNAYSNAISTGILTIGQNVDKLKNQISEFYETAQKWSEMSETERSEFISSNSKYFQDNPELLSAMGTGDYNTIESALRGSETLTTQIRQQIAQIDRELEVEMARTGDQYDAAYIEYLQNLKKTLEDSENLYKADLDIRLGQEEKYLDTYKEYLQEQQDALTDALQGRRDAYEDYFDTVNQESDDEDFEEQENTLISNIAKLSTSTSAAAVNTTADLEQQLEDLEEERLDTLRERAQEQVLNNIDTALDEINDKFDDLLNSQSAMLAAMTGELEDPTEFLSNLIVSKVSAEGLTELGFQDFVETLGETYGSIGGIKDLTDNISMRQDGDNFVINIGGQEITVPTSNQQSIAQAVYDALNAIGLR